MSVRMGLSSDCWWVLSALGESPERVRTVSRVCGFLALPNDIDRKTMDLVISWCDIERLTTVAP